MSHRWGIGAALAAALLFGASTPAAKPLTTQLSPLLLAALLYLGSGIGLGGYRMTRRAPRVRLPHREVPWLMAVVILGGVLGPILLMVGLTRMQASSSALLLNLEVVFISLIAALVFRERATVRMGLALLAAVGGAVVLTWPGTVSFGDPWAVLAVAGACLCWAIDNNCVRGVPTPDPAWLASVKGVSAGTINLILAALIGISLPQWHFIALAFLIGFITIGASSALFVTALRKIGAAQAAIYLATAPFVGAAIAVATGDPVGWPLAVAGLLMAVAIWLNLGATEQRGPVPESAHA